VAGVLGEHLHHRGAGPGDHRAGRFLIGVVLSYLSAEQLRLVGADIFIVNILGVGVIRELGPVVCSILIAGRSGSAITAQLASCALRGAGRALGNGISKTLRLILPKVMAIAVALPLLVLWTCAIALLGGAVSGEVPAGDELLSVFSSLPGAVPEFNLWLGLAKGVVFGVLIALIACHFGCASSRTPKASRPARRHRW